MEKNRVNLEKIGIYISVTIAFCTLIFYISDMKERIARLEVKVEHLEWHNVRAK